MLRQPSSLVDDDRLVEASSVNSAVLISGELEFIRTTLVSSNFCLITLIFFF